MGVASTNDLDARSSFSNYGNAIVWVAAPGEGVVTTYPFSTYAAGWGTSFSAPFVSGATALLLNKQAKTNESQASAAVAHAVPVGPDMGNGRLDIVQALQALSPADFSLSPNPITSTINSGQSATYTLTLTPVGGFNQSIALNCSGFPAASTCVITPAAVTLNGATSATATVTVQTTARAVVPPSTPVLVVPLVWTMASRLVWMLAWVAWLLVCAILHRLGRTSHQRPGLAPLAGLLAVSLCSYSCGGSYSSAPPPPGGSVTLSALTVNPTSVNGGSPSTGTVILSGPAPSGGAVVSLSSSNTSAATVPASMTVAAGDTRATVQVTTMAVANSTPVTISASYAGVTQTAPLTVTPQPPPSPTLTALTLNPTSVTGGNPSTGTVILSGPAPSGGTVVSLSSSNTSAATVPASVTVAAGDTRATVQVTTTAVANSTPATVSAPYAGVTQTASLTVTPQPPPRPTLSPLTLNPTSVNGGNPSTGTVILSGPAPSGGTVVSLSSSNTSAATVPASMTFAAGPTRATVQATTMAGAHSTPVTISASYAGVTQTASLTVTPQPPPGPTLASLTLNPTSVTSGSPSTGAVTLSAPAPSGGAVISLSSSNTAVATVPASVTVPAGATSAIFTVTTSTVATSAAINVSASYAGVTQTASLTVASAPPPGTPAGTYAITITGTSANLSHNTTLSLVVN